MSVQDLSSRIGGALAAFEFVPAESPADAPPLPAGEVRAMWKHKTWNINRGVALVEVGGEALGEPLPSYVTRIGARVGKQIGYFPFFYPLGLQLVLAGRGILVPEETLKKGLDLINNQTVLVQSVHVVDLEARASVSVRTWAQFVTGKFQDAIEGAIRDYLQVPAGV